MKLEGKYILIGVVVGVCALIGFKSLQPTLTAIGTSFGGNGGGSSFSQNTPSSGQIANMTSGTTTPCAIAISSTTTIEALATKITQATSTVGVWTIATSTTPYATTSPIQTFTVGANAQATQTWFPISGGGVVSPGTFIVWGVQGIGGTGGFVTGGTCSASLLSSN